MTEFAISVRELVQFCYRSGDIDHRFTPSPTGVQGVEGHQRVYRRRPGSYLREYPLEYGIEEEGLRLLLRGRADGYDPQQGMVEEIKTCRVAFSKIPQSASQMHLAQARLYAAILAQREGLPELEVRLTWFNIDSGEEIHLSQHYSREELGEFLAESLGRFSHWLRILARGREARDRSLQDLAFPHGEFRPGQRKMAELVYKCVDQGGQLMLEAPTGIGKSSAALYPALKALATGKHEALVYLTARNVGRRAAEDTLLLFRQVGFRGTALSLSARDSVCLSPGKACHGDDCPFARGYYDRLPLAMEAAIEAPSLRREDLDALARRFDVCPYQLAMDLLPWVDVIIADMHYVYSLTAVLAARMDRDGRRWSVLLDEAHNLPGRAREMYRAELAKAGLIGAKKGAPKPLQRALDKVNRVLLAMQKEPWEETGFHSREDLPEALLPALQQFAVAVGEQLAEQPLSLQRLPALMDFFFEVLQFQRVAEHWGDDFRFEMNRDQGRQSLRLVLNCLDPARLLGQRHASLHALAAFSATLSPAHWCRTSLGLGGEAVCSRQSSPFAREQLEVFLATGIDTRYRQRAASLPALAEVLQQWLRREPGNCIVYFPSYQYLGEALEALRQREVADVGGTCGSPESGAPAGGGPSDRCWWVQESQASKETQETLFQLLRQRRDVAAFCILGGIFGEAIDLPGEQLASVVVVGVGLPQVNRDRERLRSWHQARGVDGFAHAYLYPGMQKVDQALGRVVRRMDDRGRALLVDSRYRQAEYLDLLPPWWTYRPWE